MLVQQLPDELGVLRNWASSPPMMWQDDIIGVARFIDTCLERVHTSAGLPMGDQASD